MTTMEWILSLKLMQKGGVQLQMGGICNSVGSTKLGRAGWNKLNGTVSEEWEWWLLPASKSGY
jgi:hypothetical protein